MARKWAVVFKREFIISVDGYTWTSKYDINATHENLRIDVEEKVRSHGYIQAHDSICLQLANHEVGRTELEAVDENITLGEVIRCMGRKRLVGILRSTIPAADASFILIDNDEATGYAPLIIHIDPKRVVHGLPAPSRLGIHTNNTDTGVVASIPVGDTSNSHQLLGAGLEQSATEAGPEVAGHAEATDTLQHLDDVVIVEPEDVNSLQPAQLANLVPEVPNEELAVGNVELLRSVFHLENPDDPFAAVGMAPQMDEDSDEGYGSSFDYTTRLWSWSDDLN